MKKLLALFVTSLILLTSMSDCKKDIDSVLKGTEEDILISVDVNGRPHETTKFIINGLFLKTHYKLLYRKYDDVADSVGYELFDTPKYCGKEEWDDSFPVSFSIIINLRGELLFGKWYELDLDNSFFGGEYGKRYEITDGKMRITEKRTEPKNNVDVDYYYGEFWFNAVNEEDENDVIVAKNGRFEKLRLGRW